MENKAEDRYRKIIRISFLTGLGVLAAIVLAILFGREMPKDLDDTNAYIMTDDAWTLDALGQEPADMSKLGQYYKEGSDTLSIYYQLPQMDRAQSLVFRTKDVYTVLLVDGQVLYETPVPQSRLYNKSPGNLWNICAIMPEYSGKRLEMQIKYVYDVNAVTADHVYLGNEAAIVTDMIYKKTGALLISIIMIIAGLFLIFLTFIPKPGSKRTNNGTLYLGIYALLMGIWSILETNVVQFFIADARLLQLVSNMVMVADALPLFLYMDCEYGILKNRFFRLLCGLDSLLILICGIGQLTGLTDLHYMLQPSMLFVGVLFIVLMCVVIKRFVSGIKKDEKDPMVSLHMAGIVGLWAVTIVEIIHFSQADGMDRAVSLRLGMLVFILLFAVSSELNAYRLMQNGMQYDLVRNLAYHDGLTNLGNRTSYLEQLDKYEETRIHKLGMIFLDVNNLKQVNDNLGHEEGDRLLKLSAEVIASTFGKYGSSYRIGGDEFCVFLEMDMPEEVYKTARGEFEEAISQVNSADYYPFHLQIAHGYAECENANKLRLKEMIDQADTQMYINKEQLKRNARPA